MPFPSPTPKPPVKGSLMQQALQRLDATKIESTPDYSGVVNPYYDSAAIENVTIADTPTYSSKDVESFHKYHTNFNTVDNPYQQRADNQSWQEQLGATIYNMPINIVAGLVENVGYLGTLGETGDDKDYTNSLVELGKGLRNWGGAGQEVYQNPKDGLDFSDSGFWFNMGGGLVESIAEFYFTGAGVGSIIGKGTALLAEGAGTLSKGIKSVDKAGDFLRYVQKAKNLTDRTLTAASLSYTEGAMSGVDVYQKVQATAQKELDREVLDGQVNQKAIEKGYKNNQDYAKAIAAESAATTVRLNTMLNTTLNLTSVGAFFPSTGQQLTFNKTLNAALQQIDDRMLATTGRKLTQEERKGAIKNLINKTDDSGDNLVAKIIKDNNVSVAYKPTNGLLEGYHIGAEMVQESIEEVVNELATKAGERAGENKSILDGDLTDKYLRAFTQLESKDAFSKEAVVAALAGAVGGGGQTALTRYVALTKKPDYETYQAPVMTANDKGEVIPTEQTTLERRRKVGNMGTSPGGRGEEKRQSNYQQEQEDSKFFYDQAKQDLSNQLAFVEKQQDLINTEKQKEPHLIDWNEVNKLQEEMFTRIALSRAVRTGNGEFLINTLDDLHKTDNTKDLGVEYNKQLTQKRNELLGSKGDEDIYGQKQSELQAMAEELKSSQVQNVVSGPDYNSVTLENVDNISNRIVDNTKKVEQLSNAIQKANTPTQKAKLNQQIKDLQGNISQDTEILGNIKTNAPDAKIQEYIAKKEELLTLDTNPELIQLERISKEFRGKTEAMVKGLTTKADNPTTGVNPSADYKEKANRLTNAVKKGSQRWETINGLYNKGEVGDDEYVNELWTLTQLSDVYLEQADKYGYNTPEYQLYKSKVQGKKTEIADIFSNPDRVKEAEDFTTNWTAKLNKQFEGMSMPENLKKLSSAKNSTDFLEGMKDNEDMLAIEELYTKPFQAKFQENLKEAFKKLPNLENLDLDNIYNENRNQTLKDVNDESKSLIFGQKADRAYKQYINIQNRIDKLNTGEGKNEFVNSQKELVRKQIDKQKAIFDEQQKLANEAKKKENSKELQTEVAQSKKPAPPVTNQAPASEGKTALQQALENMSGKKESTDTDTSGNKSVAKKKSTTRKAKTNKVTEDKQNEEKITELSNELKKATNEKKALEAQLQRIVQGKDKPLTDETLSGINKTNEVIEELQEKVSTYRKNKYQELAETFNTDGANEEAILFNQEENELAGVNELAENENRAFYQELQDRFKEQTTITPSNKGSKEADIENKKADIEKRRQEELDNNNKLRVQDLKTKVAEKWDNIKFTSEKLRKYIKNEFADKHNLTQDQIDVLIEFVNMGEEDINSNPYIDFEDYQDTPNVIKKYNLREKSAKDSKAQWARLEYKFPNFTQKEILDIGNIEGITDYIANEQLNAFLSEIEGESGLPNNLAELNAIKINNKYDAELQELGNNTQQTVEDKKSEKPKSFRKIELVAGNDIIPIEELNIESISTGDILVWSWEGRKDEEDYENPRNAVNSVIGEVSRNKKGEVVITVAKDAVTKVVDGQELTTPNFVTVNTAKDGVIIYGVKKRIEGKENYIAGVEINLQNGRAELSSGQDTIDNILETFTEKSDGKTYWSGIVTPYTHENSLDKNFVLFPTVFKLERKSTNSEGKEVWQTETHSFNYKEVEDYYISNDDFAIIANTVDRGTMEMYLRNNTLLTAKAIGNIENHFYEKDKAYAKKALTSEMMDKFLDKWAGKDEIPSDDLARTKLLQEKALWLLSTLLPEENTRKLVREKSKHLDKSQYFSISTKNLLDEEIAAKLDEYGLASTTPILVKVKGDVEYFAIAVGRQNNSIILLSKDGNIFNTPSKNIKAIIRPKDDNFQQILTDKREDGFKTIAQIKKDRANKNTDTSNLDYLKSDDKNQLREKSPFVESIDNLMTTYLTGKKLEDYEENSDEGNNVFFQLGYLRYVKAVIKNSDTEADVKKEHITTINNAIDEIIKGELWKNTIGKMRKVVNQLQQGDFVVVNTKNEDDSRSNRTYMFIEPTTSFGGWALEVGRDRQEDTGYKFEKSKENNLKWIGFQDDYALSNYQFYRTKDNRPTTIGYNYNQELSKIDIKDRNSYVHENYAFSSLGSMEQVMNLKEGDLISVTNIGKDDVRYTGYKIIKSVDSTQDKDGETVYTVSYFTGKGLHTIRVDENGQNDNTQVLGFGIRRVDNQKRRKLIMERFLAKTRKKESIIQIPNEGNISIPTSLQWYGYKSRIINPDSKVDKEYWEHLQEGDVVVYEVDGNTYIRPVANVVSDQTFYNMEGNKGNMKTLVVYTTPKNGDFTQPITLADNQAKLNPNKPVEIITKSYSSSQIKIKAVFYAPHNFKTISKEIKNLDKQRYQEYKDKSKSEKEAKPSKKSTTDKNNNSAYTKEQFEKDINKNNALDSTIDISENTELAEDIQDSTELRKGEQGDNYTQGHPLDNGKPVSELEEVFAEYMQNFFKNKSEEDVEKFANRHKLKVISPTTKEGKALYDKYYGDYDWAKNTGANRPILTTLVTNDGELVLNENQVPIVSQITVTKTKDKGTQQEKVRKGIIETWKKDNTADIMLQLNKSYPVKSGTKNWLKDGLRPVDKWEQATNEKLDIAVAKPQAAGQSHYTVTTKAGTNRKISSGHTYSILHDKVITYYSNTIAEMKPELVGKVSNTVLATLLLKLNGEEAITTDTGQIIKYWQNLDDIFFTGIAMNNGNPVYADNSPNIPIYELAVLRPKKDNAPYLLMRGITKLDNFDTVFGKYNDVFEKEEVDDNTFIKITPVKNKGKYTFNSNQLEFLKTFIGQKQFNVNSINLSNNSDNFELLNYSQEITPNIYPIKANFKLEDQGMTYQEFLKENVLMTDVTVEPIKLKARGFIYGDIIPPNVKSKATKTEETKEAEIVTTGPTVITTFGKSKKATTTEETVIKETENTGPTVVSGFGKAKPKTTTEVQKEVENTGPTVTGAFGKIKVKPDEKVTVKFGNKDKENFKECTGKKSGSNRVDKINLDE